MWRLKASLIYKSHALIFTLHAMMHGHREHALYFICILRWSLMYLLLGCHDVCTILDIYLVFTTDIIIMHCLDMALLNINEKIVFNSKYKEIRRK